MSFFRLFFFFCFFGACVAVRIISESLVLPAGEKSLEWTVPGNVNWTRAFFLVSFSLAATRPSSLPHPVLLVESGVIRFHRPTPTIQPITPPPPPPMLSPPSPLPPSPPPPVPAEPLPQPVNNGSLGKRQLPASPPTFAIAPSPPLVIKKSPVRCDIEVVVVEDADLFVQRGTAASVQAGERRSVFLNRPVNSANSFGVAWSFEARTSILSDNGVFGANNLASIYFSEQQAGPSTANVTVSTGLPLSGTPEPVSPDVSWQLVECLNQRTNGFCSVYSFKSLFAAGVAEGDVGDALPPLAVPIVAGVQLAGPFDSGEPTLTGLALDPPGAVRAYAGAVPDSSVARLNLVVFSQASRVQLVQYSVPQQSNQSPKDLPMKEVLPKKKRQETMSVAALVPLEHAVDPTRSFIVPAFAGGMGLVVPDSPPPVIGVPLQLPFFTCSFNGTDGSAVLVHISRVEEAAQYGASATFSVVEFLDDSDSPTTTTSAATVSDSMSVLESTPLAGSVDSASRGSSAAPQQSSIGLQASDFQVKAFLESGPGIGIIGGVAGVLLGICVLGIGVLVRRGRGKGGSQRRKSSSHTSVSMRALSGGPGGLYSGGGHGNGTRESDSRRRRSGHAASGQQRHSMRRSSRRSAMAIEVDSSVASSAAPAVASPYGSLMGGAPSPDALMRSSNIYANAPHRSGTTPPTDYGQMPIHGAAMIPMAGQQYGLAPARTTAVAVQNSSDYAPLSLAQANFPYQIARTNSTVSVAESVQY